MTWDKKAISQIQLPDPQDDDEHPRLLLDGEGIHAGQSFFALLPDGWKAITLEVNWSKSGAACWYIPAPEYRDICPVGLFVTKSKEQTPKTIQERFKNFDGEYEFEAID